MSTTPMTKGRSRGLVALLLAGSVLAGCAGVDGNSAKRGVGGAAIGAGAGAAIGAITGTGAGTGAAAGAVAGGAAGLLYDQARKDSAYTQP